MAYYCDFYGYCVMFVNVWHSLVSTYFGVLWFVYLIVWGFTSHSLGERSNPLRNRCSGYIFMFVNQLQSSIYSLGILLYLSISYMQMSLKKKDICLLFS